uniref:RNA-directed DNA polymerase (Reverse transcriptase) n=1 Tax=Solanum tuberosum TaxID=4113 RepID=M1A3E6_SOLTU
MQRGVEVVGNGYCRRIKVEEVKGVVQGCIGVDRKARQVEFWKSIDGVGLEWLTKLFNVVFKTAKMSEVCRLRVQRLCCTRTRVTFEIVTTIRVSSC